MNTVRRILENKGHDIWLIAPDATVFEALRRMADRDVGALLVFEGEKLVGIFSERDYARKIILQGKSSKDTLVREVMVTDYVAVHPETTLHECMEIMNNRRMRHLPVMDGDEVMGVVSIGDVVRYIIYNQAEVIKSLEAQLQPKKQTGPLAAPERLSR